MSLLSCFIERVNRIPIQNDPWAAQIVQKFIEVIPHRQAVPEFRMTVQTITQTDIVRTKQDTRSKLAPFITNSLEQEERRSRFKCTRSQFDAGETHESN